MYIIYWFCEQQTINMLYLFVLFHGRNKNRLAYLRIDEILLPLGRRKDRLFKDVAYLEYCRRLSRLAREVFSLARQTPSLLITGRETTIRTFLRDPCRPSRWSYCICHTTLYRQYRYGYDGRGIKRAAGRFLTRDTVPAYLRQYSAGMPTVPGTVSWIYIEVSRSQEWRTHF